MNIIEKINKIIDTEIAVELKNNHQRCYGMEQIKQTIADMEESKDIGLVSDGSHSFNELYYHRMILFAVICNNFKDKAWKSWLHHDGTMYKDYFVVGVSIEGTGDFSYHYHKSCWDIFNKVKEVELAPKWDGHTSQDVIRLLKL